MPRDLNHSNIGRLLTRHIGFRGVGLRSLKTLLTNVGRLHFLSESISFALKAVPIQVVELVHIHEEGYKRKRQKTYMQPAIMAINTGTPTPTLTPMMTLLLTPPVSPLITLLIPEDDVAVETGTYDTGVPLVALSFWIFVPKAIVLTRVFCVVAGNVAAEPEGTAVTRVLVTVFFDVDCSETGQFTSPVDRHAVAVYVTSVLVVMVVKSFLAITVAAALAAAVALPVAAQTPARVVYQIGICVLGVGPQVCSPIASVAPAFAPSSIEYSSTTCRSQLLLSEATVTLVTNWATSAQTPISRPVLKSRGNPSTVSEGVLKSRPAVTPRRRRAVSTTPAL